MALRFSLNALDRTLTMEEACEVRDKIVASLYERYGAVLRT